MLHSGQGWPSWTVSTSESPSADCWRVRSICGPVFSMGVLSPGWFPLPAVPRWLLRHRFFAVRTRYPRQSIVAGARSFRFPLWSMATAAASSERLQICASSASNNGPVPPGRAGSVASQKSMACPSAAIWVCGKMARIFSSPSGSWESTDGSICTSSRRRTFAARATWATGVAQL